jgi:transcriptional regulator with XRE-family HTH domain
VKGMNVGKQIKRAREEAGMSQEEVAAKAGISRVYLSELEGNKKSVSLSVFMRLSRAVNLLPSKLMSRIEKES